MLNTGKFAGRTIIISGASRGIGLAIAKKLAKDGANIAILAKTTTPHPKLPGTIYTAAEEVEKLGGKALPCVVDIRDEGQVQKAVEDTVNKFGGIDICINNASAISMTNTINTSMKTYDLMNSCNTRGTFMLSQKCIPYLKQSKNPHILNMSPPLLMEPHWFANHTAYTIAKYGMSMCVLGMAEEFKSDGIAVNALWPKTAIWTSAMELLSGGQESGGSRKAEIVADAAYSVLSKNSRNYSGKFLIDEDVLKEEGVTDFEQYACKPGAKLILDLFVPGSSFDHFTADNEHQKSRDSLSKVSLDEAIETVKKVAHLKDLKTNAVFHFKVNDSSRHSRSVFLDLKNGTASDSPNSVKPDVVFEMSASTFVDMIEGSLSPTAAFMSKKLKVSGDLTQALKFEKALQAVGPKTSN
ncbi:SCP2 domain-containing protein [Aphelenchoides besseyi]|nr:SCP2 domain-containing protein [Aphelenchoides besseyi]KAI6201949.1 SCP2 domain-containing protein [Aphelenchoides besseyi]